MFKAKIIIIAVRFLFAAIALGVGIWYLSSSIGGASLTYTSLPGFLRAIGVGDGDIASVNGCFLCGYIEKLFGAIGAGTEMFWTAIVDHLWIVLAIGFGVWLFLYSAKYIYDAAVAAANPDDKERKIELAPWVDKVWKLGSRVMIVGVLMGALGMGGTGALRVVTNITVTPVMFVGSELAMAATGVESAAACPMSGESDDVLNPVLRPFMCVMGNLNTVMLAGAAAGFSLMNYAWLGMGGGAMTWVAGLALVIIFLMIGFNLFFQVLSVVFRLIFVIIFMPLLLAASAFEGTWKLADGLVKNAVEMLFNAAVQIVAITLKILIIYATISYAADMTMPGPRDGYSAIMPPLMGISGPVHSDAQTMAIHHVFSTCEQVGLQSGEMDADAFRQCFNTQKTMVERRYPGAFDFLDDGWDFLMVMVGLCLLYFYVVNPKVDGILAKKSSQSFDFGGAVKELGKKIWGIPQNVVERISKAIGGKE